VATEAQTDGGGDLVPTPALAPLARISMGQIARLSQRAGDMMHELRGTLLAPGAEKSAPMISSTRLAALCGIDKAKLAYRVTRGDLPVGRVTATGGLREFTVPESRVWTRSFRADRMRPAGQKALTLASSNFKGGSNKTTTATVLAQGLALRGHKVLAVDCDPQGSMSTLFGLLPGADIDSDMTILELISNRGEEPAKRQLQFDDLRYAVRDTYWDGLDLIAAAPLLFDAEFMLPSLVTADRTAKFWNVVNEGLEPLRDLYDVIIIDTPPSLSYVTLNALFAADGLIVPIPPSALDYASLSQFWALFSDLGSDLEKRGPDPKFYDFIHVLLTQVEPDNVDAVTGPVRRWVQSVYGEYLLPIEIPKTSATKSSAAQFGTIYDVGRNDMNARTYKRALDAYDRFVELIEASIVQTWRNRLLVGAARKQQVVGGGDQVATPAV
ncbi:AAA family ATPase, partial [Variovorax sp. RA8]|uniref:AAA family ATPase n=1 Tax=Variovorax sp. (strain JCM 16519 / RA8) TaxID=662548 RepID=UPI002F962F36